MLPLFGLLIVEGWCSSKLPEMRGEDDGETSGVARVACSFDVLTNRGLMPAKLEGIPINSFVASVCT